MNHALQQAAGEEDVVDERLIVLLGEHLENPEAAFNEVECALHILTDDLKPVVIDLLDSIWCLERALNVLPLLYRKQGH